MLFVLPFFQNGFEGQQADGGSGFEQLEDEVRLREGGRLAHHDEAEERAPASQGRRRHVLDPQGHVRGQVRGVRNTGS